MTISELEQKYSCEIVPVINLEKPREYHVKVWAKSKKAADKIVRKLMEEMKTSL
jgi:hypothetical protein